MINEEMFLSNLSYEKVTEKNKHHVLNWLEKDHIRTVWADEGRTIRDLESFLKGSSFFEHWFALYDNAPFAYIMRHEEKYDPEDSFGCHLDPQKKIAGLDFLIGEENFLGKKLAHHVLREFIRRHCNDVDMVTIDPATKNTKAIHVYQKVGFRKKADWTPESGPFKGMPHLIMSMDTCTLCSK